MTDSEDAWLDRDYRALYDSTYLRPWELPRHDVVVVIERVVRATIKYKDGDESAPLLFFRGKKKPLVSKKCMSKVLKGLYGKTPRSWLGKPITLYVTQVDAFGETHDVIRIRNTIPKRQKAPKPDALPELPPASIADAEFEETPETQPQESTA